MLPRSSQKAAAACLMWALLACSDGPAPLSGRFGDHPSCEVTAPPAALELDPIYTRYLNCSGVAVLATDGVMDEALKVADETIEFMLMGLDDVRERLMDASFYYILRGDDVLISELPERFQGYPDDNGGWTDEGKHSATSRGNEVVCRVPRGDVWYDNNILLHELTHVVHLGAFPEGSATDRKIEAAYDAARAQGLWTNTYAGFNFAEYFAELTQKWFEVGRRRGPEDGDGLANHIITRAELLAYDPGGHALVASFFNTSFDVPGCFQRNVVHPYADASIACPPTVSDADGTSYAVVRIGDQCWMASNLRTSRFRDGSPVPELSEGTAWAGASGPGQCVFEGDAGNIETRGRLYNHAAISDERGLCPEGMHVPTIAEVDAFGRRLEFGRPEGASQPSQLRAVGAWTSPATDDFGFAARPSGARDAAGNFNDGGTWRMWLAERHPDDGTKGVAAAIFDNFEGFGRGGPEELRRGLSVRCVSP